MYWTGIADGIGFVFYQGERNQVGGYVGDLGIYGVTDAFGWKVDTWYNDSTHPGINTQILNGDYDDGFTNPYGAFITTDNKGYGTIDKPTAQEITKSIEDNQFHNIKFVYNAASKEFRIVLSTPNGDITFIKQFDFDESNPAYYFTIAASAGALPTQQAFRIDNMQYSPIQKANFNYIDDTTGKLLSSDSVTGNGGTKIDYSTSNKIAEYQSQGYTLISDAFTKGVNFDDDDTVDQTFDIHLAHSTTSVTPDDPQKPGQPIDPDNPDGPKWPNGTDKGSLTKTITRTINYLDKQTGKVVSK